MKKLIIFDLDGTLINTIADLGSSTNYALKRLGYPTHDLESYKMRVGNGINNLFRRALPEGEKTDENVLRIRREFIPYYNAHNTDLSRPYPGMIELLEALQGEGVLLAVASNKYQEATSKIITELLPTIRFSAILGQSEGINIKPDPQIVYDILATTNMAKDDVFYIGDSGVDMQTGLNAGVETCGVTWGFRSREELESFHPHHIVDSVEELKRKIL